MVLDDKVHDGGLGVPKVRRSGWERASLCKTYVRSTGAVWFEIPCMLRWLGYAESTVEGCVRCTSESFEGHRLHTKEVMPIKDKIAQLGKIQSLL